MACIDACSLANNHTLDFEERGLLDTLEHLDAADIRHTGAGRDEREAARPALLQARAERVAFVAFTDNEPPFAAGPDKGDALRHPQGEGQAAYRTQEGDGTSARP